MNDTLNQLPKITKALKKYRLWVDECMSGFTCSHGVTNQQFEFIRKFKWIFIGVRNRTTGLIANPALSSKGNQRQGQRQGQGQMVVRCIGCIAIIISISISICRGIRSCRLSDAFQNLDIYNCIPIVSTWGRAEQPVLLEKKCLRLSPEQRKNRARQQAAEGQVARRKGGKSNQVPLMKP